MMTGETLILHNGLINTPNEAVGFLFEARHFKAKSAAAVFLCASKAVSRQRRLFTWTWVAFCFSSRLRAFFND